MYLSADLCLGSGFRAPNFWEKVLMSKLGSWKSYMHGGRGVRCGTRASGRTGCGTNAGCGDGAG